MHNTNDSAEGNNSTITKEAKTTDPHKDIDKTLPTSINFLSKIFNQFKISDP